MMGVQSSAANIGAMLMLILSLVCLPKAAEQSRAEGEKNASGFLMLLKNPKILVACLLSLLVTMLFNTAPTNLSMLLAENDLGTAAQAGTSTTLLLLSGTAGGLLFGKLSVKLGRNVMAFGFGMMALGQMVCAFAPNLAMVFAGRLVCGCAISSVMPQTTLDAAAQSSAKAAGATAFRFILSAVSALAAAIIIVVRVRK